MILAFGDLLSRGLIVSEGESELGSLQIDGRGYRYRSGFWMLTGVLESDGSAWRLRLTGEDARHAKRRVAEEWIAAGAPVPWAQAQADAAVALLLARPDAATRDCVPGGGGTRRGLEV